jgi:hypothetical protein
VTAGFEALGTDVLAFADADGATDLHSLASVIAPVRDEAVALTAGSRRHPDATVETHQTYARRFLGDGFARLAGALLDVSLYDYQCGAKAIDAGVWEEIRHHLYEPGFAWDVELIAMTAAFGHEIREVPITWHDQPGSTVDPLRTAVGLARTLFAARHRAKQIQDDPIHSAIASRRTQPQSLVEKHE